MSTQIDTICHATRVNHEFFGEVDVLDILHEDGPVDEGAVGWILRADGSSLKLVVKGFWKERRSNDPSSVLIVVEPLPVHPTELEGCAVQWGEPF